MQNIVSTNNTTFAKLSPTATPLPHTNKADPLTGIAKCLFYFSKNLFIWQTVHLLGFQIFNYTKKCPILIKNG